MFGRFTELGWLRAGGGVGAVIIATAFGGWSTPTSKPKIITCDLLVRTLFECCRIGGEALGDRLIDGDLMHR